MKTFSLVLLSVCFATSLPLKCPAEGPRPGPQAVLPELKKFDLDFKGGTPADLVAAISAARGKPVNAIVSPDYAHQQIPAFKVVGVDIAQLFLALKSASHQFKRSLAVQWGPTTETGYGFETEGNPSDDSVWHFTVNTGPGLAAEPPPPLCRFYSLSPFLDSGLTVDDITTAIQTGWKMMGLSPTPSMSYHKETKLLIAVGTSIQLQVIDEALQALHSFKPINTPHAAASPPPLPKKAGGP